MRLLLNTFHSGKWKAAAAKYIPFKRVKEGRCKIDFTQEDVGRLLQNKLYLREWKEATKYSPFKRLEKGCCKINSISREWNEAAAETFHLGEWKEAAAK